MSPDLIARFAEPLGLATAEARPVLTRLIESIHRLAEEYGGVHVPGLGTFRREGDTLAFDATTDLADAVNHRYVGLTPLTPRGSAPAEAPLPTLELDAPLRLNLPTEPPLRDLGTLDQQAPAEDVRLPHEMPPADDAPQDESDPLDLAVEPFTLSLDSAPEALPPSEPNAPEDLFDDVWSIDDLPPPEPLDLDAPLSRSQAPLMSPPTEALPLEDSPTPSEESAADRLLPVEPTAPDSPEADGSDDDRISTDWSPAGSIPMDSASRTDAPMDDVPLDVEANFIEDAAPDFAEADFVEAAYTETAPIQDLPVEEPESEATAVKADADAEPAVAPHAADAVGAEEAETVEETEAAEELDAEVIEPAVDPLRPAASEFFGFDFGGDEDDAPGALGGAWTDWDATLTDAALSDDTLSDDTPSHITIAEPDGGAPDATRPPAIPTDEVTPFLDAPFSDAPLADDASFTTGPPAEPASTPYAPVAVDAPGSERGSAESGDADLNGSDLDTTSPDVLSSDVLSSDVLSSDVLSSEVDPLDMSGLDTDSVAHADLDDVSVDDFLFAGTVDLATEFDEPAEEAPDALTLDPLVESTFAADDDIASLLEVAKPDDTTSIDAPPLFDAVSPLDAALDADLSVSGSVLDGPEDLTTALFDEPNQDSATDPIAPMAEGDDAAVLPVTNSVPTAEETDLTSFLHDDLWDADDPTLAGTDLTDGNAPLPSAASDLPSAASDLPAASDPTALPLGDMDAGLEPLDTPFDLAANAPDSLPGIEWDTPETLDLDADLAPDAPEDVDDAAKLETLADVSSLEPSAFDPQPTPFSDSLDSVPLSRDAPPSEMPDAPATASGPAADALPDSDAAGVDADLLAGVGALGLAGMALLDSDEDASDPTMDEVPPPVAEAHDFFTPPMPDGPEPDADLMTEMDETPWVPDEATVPMDAIERPPHPTTEVEVTELDAAEFAPTADFTPMEVDGTPDLDTVTGFDTTEADVFQEPAPGAWAAAPPPEASPQWETLPLGTLDDAPPSAAPFQATDTYAGGALPFEQGLPDADPATMPLTADLFEDTPAPVVATMGGDPPTERERRSAWPWLLLLLLLLALPAAGYYLWQQLNAPTEAPVVLAPATADPVSPDPDLDPNTGEQIDPVAADPLDDAEAPPDPFDAASGDDAPESILVEDAPAEPADTQDEASSPVLTALRGTGDIDVSQGGYTWVVTTDVNAGPSAQEQVAQYRAMGFRSGIVVGTVDGVRVERVCIGQFATIPLADEALGLLPEGISSSSWKLNLNSPTIQR
ncbi:MAG: hypothetical protein AAF624_02510 [Bacteroidota bacterium]